MFPRPVVYLRPLGRRRAMPDEGLRVGILRRIRYNLYKASHGSRPPWDRLQEQTALYARLGSARRCKVCGLSIRGPLGLLNRAIWGVVPLSKHPDLCSVCRVGERLLEVTVLFADARGFTSYAEDRPPEQEAQAPNEMFT